MKKVLVGSALALIVCGLAALPAAARTHNSAEVSAGHLPGGMVPARVGDALALRRAMLAPKADRETSGFSCAEPCDRTPLSYHGGPVMHTNTIYAIYWVPSGFTMSSQYQNIVTGYFQNVAHLSGATENVYPVAQQYSDHSGHVQYNSTFGGAYVDTTSAIPANDCGSQYADYNLFPSGCVTEQDEIDEVKAAMAANGWTASPSHMFMLFTPQNTGSCIEDGSVFDFNYGVCSYTYYCGYHDFFPGTGGTVIWANLSFPTLPGVPADDCDSLEHPNHDVADAVLSVTSHEHNEAITDPQLNAWWQNGNGLDAGEENGDKCAWNFGASLGSTGGANTDYNQQIGTGQYYLQQEWSNAGTQCLLNEPQKKISIKTYTASGFTGGAVTITGGQFQDATNLTVNGVSWPYTLVNTSTITTTVPAGATSGKLTLVDPPFGSVQSSSMFEVLPHVTGLTAASGHAGDPVTITGTSFLGAVVKFGSVADTNAVVGETSISAHIPPNAVAGPLTVTTTGGVSSSTFTVLPVLDSLPSASGLAGATMILTGQTLGTASKVAFGSPMALGAITTKTPTALTVKVPTSGVTGHVTVTLASGATVTSTDAFTVLPRLLSFAPTSAIAGTHVTIKGTGLANTTSVQFNGVPAASFTATATKIDAVVPADATKGTFTIDTSDGTPTQLSGLFSPVPHVTSIPAVQAGQTATVTGTNLSGATLTFGGHPLSYNSGTATATGLTTVALDSAAVTGPLKVTTPAGTTTATLGIRPTITGVSPPSGHAGDTIMITGNTLKSPTSVTFGSASAKGTIKSSTSGAITVSVPSNAVTGNITVTNSAGPTQSAQTFTVLPRITSFSPGSGPVGTLVKIRGSGLNGTTSVTFGGHSAVTVTSVSSTEVDAKVPADAVDGVIRVTTGVGFFDSLTSFNVT